MVNFQSNAHREAEMRELARLKDLRRQIWKCKPRKIYLSLNDIKFGSVIREKIYLPRR